MPILFKFFTYIALNFHSVDTSYVVHYELKIFKAQKDFRFPKVAVPEEYRSAIGKDSVSIENILPFPYIIGVEMRVSSNGTYSIKDWPESAGLHLSSNNVKYFDGRKYFTSDDSSALKPLQFIYRKTNETRSILGYHCTKFIASEKGDEQFNEIWATDELPATITGLFRLPQFGYAVLEISDSEGMWKKTATKITVEK